MCRTGAIRVRYSHIRYHGAHNGVFHASESLPMVGMRVCRAQPEASVYCEINPEPGFPPMQLGSTTQAWGAWCELISATVVPLRQEATEVLWRDYFSINYWYRHGWRVSCYYAPHQWDWTRNCAQRQGGCANAVGKWKTVACRMKYQGKRVVTIGASIWWRHSRSSTLPYRSRRHVSDLISDVNSRSLGLSSHVPMPWQVVCILPAHV